MNTSDLKLDVIGKIAELKEVRIIQEIKRLLDFELEEQVFEMSNKQKDRIAKAKSEYANSEILTEEEANSEIELWLKEK